MFRILLTLLSCYSILEYKNISGKTLQKSIEKEISGDLEELLVAIGTVILYLYVINSNTQKSLGIGCKMYFCVLIIYTFCSSEVCDEYSCILCWKTLQKHEGTDRNTLLSVIVFVQHWCLFVNLQGAGTNEITLTRVMVSRGEVDMLDIRAEFKKLYQQSLYKEISVSVLHWWNKL